MTTTLASFPVRGTPRRQRTSVRLSQAIARLRRKQLQLAMAGRIADSARYAQRVQKLLQIAC